MLLRDIKYAREIESARPVPLIIAIGRAPVPDGRQLRRPPRGFVRPNKEHRGNQSSVTKSRENIESHRRRSR